MKTENIPALVQEILQRGHTPALRRIMDGPSYEGKQTHWDSADVLSGNADEVIGRIVTDIEMWKTKCNKGDEKRKVTLELISMPVNVHAPKTGRAALDKLIAKEPSNLTSQIGLVSANYMLGLIVSVGNPWCLKTAVNFGIHHSVLDGLRYADHGAYVAKIFAGSQEKGERVYFGSIAVRMDTMKVLGCHVEPGVRNAQSVMDFVSQAMGYGEHASTSLWEYTPPSHDQVVNDDVAESQSGAPAP